MLVPLATQFAYRRDGDLGWQLIARRHTDLKYRPRFLGEDVALRRGKEWE